jgi:hypothetical protein
MQIEIPDTAIDALREALTPILDRLIEEREPRRARRASGPYSQVPLGILRAGTLQAWYPRIGVWHQGARSPKSFPMIVLVGDRPQRFWVADECDACHGTGRSQLPPGQFATGGGSTVRCRSCGGEGVTNKRWEPPPTR